MGCGRVRATGKRIGDKTHRTRGRCGASASVQGKKCGRGREELRSGLQAVGRCSGPDERGNDGRGPPLSRPRPPLPLDRGAFPDMRLKGGDVIFAPFYAHAIPMVCALLLQGIDGRGGLLARRFGPGGCRGGAGPGGGLVLGILQALQLPMLAAVQDEPD